jgi:hypothetical protein
MPIPSNFVEFNFFSLLLPFAKKEKKLPAFWNLSNLTRFSLIIQKQWQKTNKYQLAIFLGKSFHTRPTFARDKHCSLLCPAVSDKKNKFSKIETWTC